METTDAGSAGAPGPGPAAGRDGQQRFFATVRGWGVVRGEDRWFAGVCGALARRLGVDAVVVRGVLVALTVVGGLGLALYGVAWALLPDARGRIEAEAALRGDVSASLAGAGALVVVDLVVGGGVTGMGLGWWDSGPGWSVLVTLLVGALGWWLVRDLHRCRADDATAPAPGLSLRKEPPPATPPVTAPAPPTAWVPPPAGQRPGPAAGYGSAVERRVAARLEAKEKARLAAARRRPGSPLATSLALGLALLLAGAVLVLAQLRGLPGDAVPLALVAAVTVLGLGAVVAGVRGRRTALVRLATPLALAAVAASVLPAGGGWRWEVDQQWAPTPASLRQRADTASVVGRLVVDPAAVASTPGRATATVAAGRLDVLVPTGGTVLVAARVAAGTVSVQDSPDVVPVLAAGERTSGTTAGGFDVERVYAVGPQAAAVAAATTVRGQVVDDWTVPADAGTVITASTWAGEVRIAAAGSRLLEED